MPDGKKYFSLGRVSTQRTFEGPCVVPTSSPMPRPFLCGPAITPPLTGNAHSGAGGRLPLFAVCLMQQNFEVEAVLLIQVLEHFGPYHMEVVAFVSSEDA